MDPETRLGRSLEALKRAERQWAAARARWERTDGTAAGYAAMVAPWADAWERRSREHAAAWRERQSAAAREGVAA